MSGANWAGNVRWSAEEVVRPHSAEELADLVARASRVHAVGTGHSFSTVADGPGLLVALDRLPQDVRVDQTTGTVDVPAAIRLGDLSRLLHEQGYALRTLPSLPHIGAAGTVATATHGSGDGHGTLAADVRRLELVTAGGATVVVGPDDPDFLGYPVGLGALGVVVRLTLDLVPAFQVSQRVFLDLPWAAALDRLDAILASAYSVSLFTCWDSPVVDQVWVKQRVAGGAPAAADPAALAGAVRAAEPRHPVPGVDPAACTEQLGVPGPWLERLPHFRPDHTPSHGAELQSEYFVARERGAEALAAVRRVGPLIRPALLVSEVRSVAADRLWLSPAHARDSVAIHFTWTSDDRLVREAIRVVEEALAPFAPRPHWGKLFAMPPDVLAAAYPHLDDARRLAAAVDPAGVFRNAFLDAYLPSP